jgi:hypothetical protein
MLTLGEQLPFPDRSHDREGSFIPSANYHVPAENLGYSPQSRTSLRKPELETEYESRPLNPYIYSPLTSSWHLFKRVPREGSFSQGRSLRVVSWNIYFEGPDLGSRGSSAMAPAERNFRGFTNPNSHYSPRGAPPVARGYLRKLVDQGKFCVIKCESSLTLLHPCDGLSRDPGRELVSCHFPTRKRRSGCWHPNHFSLRASYTPILTLWNHRDLSLFKPAPGI